MTACTPVDRKKFEKPRASTELATSWQVLVDSVHAQQLSRALTLLISRRRPVPAESDSPRKGQSFSSFQLKPWRQLSAPIHRPRQSRTSFQQDGRHLRPHLRGPRPDCLRTWHAHATCGAKRAAECWAHAPRRGAVRHLREVHISFLADPALRSLLLFQEGPPPVPEDTSLEQKREERGGIRQEREIEPSPNTSRPPTRPT